MIIKYGLASEFAQGNAKKDKLDSTNYRVQGGFSVVNGLVPAIVYAVRFVPADKAYEFTGFVFAV